MSRLHYGHIDHYLQIRASHGLCKRETKIWLISFATDLQQSPCLGSLLRDLAYDAKRLGYVEYLKVLVMNAREQQQYWVAPCACQLLLSSK